MGLSDFTVRPPWWRQREIRSWVPFAGLLPTSARRPWSSCSSPSSDLTLNMATASGAPYRRVIRSFSKKCREGQQNMFLNSETGLTLIVSRSLACQGALSYRRLQGDMITTYQILHGNLDVDQGLLQLSTTRHTRGHAFKLNIPRARCLPRRQFFTIRSAAHWNGLPSSVVSAPSLSAFKSRLDLHWKSIQYETIFDE